MTELAIGVGLWFIGALIAFTILSFMGDRYTTEDDFFGFLMLSMIWPVMLPVILLLVPFATIRFLVERARQ